MKQRIDVWLAAHGLVESREKAQALIMAGQVYIGEKKVLKASEQAEEDAPVTIRGDQAHFASRGGHKLEKAITAFGADVTGLVAMDIGAASGGFTDVLLRHGAAHVYAIDVGYGQLDWKLRNDSRVTVMERTNARALTREHFPVQPTLTVMDVSFISIKLILPVAAQIMGEQGRFLTLVKPQFGKGDDKSSPPSTGAFSFLRYNGRIRLLNRFLGSRTVLARRPCQKSYKYMLFLIQ